MRTFALIGAAALMTSLGGDLAAQRQGTFLAPDENTVTTRVAQRGANFLEIGVGARAQAMGNALSGLATGATAMYWNPAGMASIDGFTTAFSRTALYDNLDITHTFAAAAMPFMGGGMGFSFIQLSSGDIQRTTEDNPGGGDVEFGDIFSWTGTAVGAHYARRLTDRLQVGFTGRAITEGLDQAKANWWGLDFGTVFNTGLYGITIGAVLANIGPSARMEGNIITRRVTATDAFPVALPVRFSTVDYALPTAFRFSVVSNLVGGADALLSPSQTSSFKLAADLNDATDTDVQLSLGAEYGFRDMLYLRGGKRWVREAGLERDFTDDLSFGGGIVLPLLGRHLKFDYAYTSLGDLQNVQVFSFELGGR